MKFFNILLIFFVLGSCFINTQDYKAFNDANLLYNNHSYQKAMESYNSITNKTWSCWFNMGNCFYKLKKYDAAFIHWKKALHEANFLNLKDIEFNLSKAKNKLSIKNDHFGEFYKIIVEYFDLIPIIYFQIIFLLFWYLSFFNLITKKKLLYFNLGFFFFCSFVFFVALGTKLNKNNYERGIVIDKEIKVFSGPSNDYHTIGLLNFADEIRINNKKNNQWIKVSNEKIAGWVLSRSVFIL